MNQWPGVRLRVTEAWDDSRLHAPNSLHYEGRAVDITTSDRDRSKYGMLARLAVEAGFDWVYYESRFHIHCSVKSESVASSSRYGGCFSADTEAVLADGRRRRFDQLRRGDVVLAVDESGALVESEVILWLDRDPAERRLFHRIVTAGGRTLRLTPGHLVWQLDAESAAAGNHSLQDARVTFARRLIVGDYLLVADADGRLTAELVTQVAPELVRGVYAPLTRHGTVLANGAVASCYAQVDSQTVAHWALLPARWAANARQWALHLWRAVGGGVSGRAAAPPTSGVHWYARLLYSLSDALLPRDMMLD
ncbi:Protein hedgehog [Amphibalanus amphitrite]|uniref:Protein hedgehog n=1 Tax=Amphibalanus amphitrite TaxID=1232801 RepID=A0A6A4WJ30_AMPAM|nr:Protein hedgehog [Amphibalanus amphitrite]